MLLDLDRIGPAIFDRITQAIAPTAQFGRITALGLRGPKSSTISSTVTIERFAASTASFCTPTIPSRRTLPSASAFWAWMTATSGLRAGTQASDSPVNGQETKRILGLTAGRSTPR